MENSAQIRLTQYSHGAGCGCKISPSVLTTILASNQVMPDQKNLLVGNHSRDDAAVYDLQNGTALISTTDFFMPIVDDPYQFGAIASANAISDVYAMGGTPILAIAILGWPISALPAEIAAQVIEGSRSMCARAGIALAGGHSIDSPEPIFGLAVNGLVDIPMLKQNNTALPTHHLYLTKPLGIGILTTAEKKGILKPQHHGMAARLMMQLNNAGAALGRIKGVSAMTDITGFGLLGHLGEMCAGSNVQAVLDFHNIPLMQDIDYYIGQGAIPGGTHRNWASYGNTVGPIQEKQKLILADPQTSGGLLIAAAPQAAAQIEEIFEQYLPGHPCIPIGYLEEQIPNGPLINIH